ncbi:MAG: nuclear transport factor 2 family protein [Caulobacter sp.]|nr:nuclear transport factor 2 family protein [Caulobacter sp.]
MTTIEKLLAIEAIKTLFARRVRAMDQKDWVLYDTLHAPHAVLKSFSPDQAGLAPLGSHGGQLAAVGKAAILEAIRTLLDGEVKVTTVHHAHTPEIEITSDTTATGIWAMEDMLWWDDDGETQFAHGYGHYYETYEKIDGTWLIASRTIRRLRSDTPPDFFRYMKAG